MSAAPERKRNGLLRIPLPFEDAIRAALETRPSNGEKKEKRPARKRKKKPP